eukprot:m.9471 g.9471  ORF g.9471 m.9471 type:complete len:84 (+) comp4181_c0_seq1:2599-2850(+)
MRRPFGALKRLRARCYLLGGEGKEERNAAGHCECPTHLVHVLGAPLLSVGFLRPLFVCGHHRDSWIRVACATGLWQLLPGPEG